MTMNKLLLLFSVLLLCCLVSCSKQPVTEPTTKVEETVPEKVFYREIDTVFGIPIQNITETTADDVMIQVGWMKDTMGFKQSYIGKIGKWNASLFCWSLSLGIDLTIESELTNKIWRSIREGKSIKELYGEEETDFDLDQILEQWEYVLSYFVKRYGGWSVSEYDPGGHKYRYVPEIGDYVDDGSEFDGPIQTYTWYFDNGILDVDVPLDEGNDQDIRIRVSLDEWYVKFWKKEYEAIKNRQRLDSVSIQALQRVQ